MFCPCFLFFERFLIDQLSKHLPDRNLQGWLMNDVKLVFRCHKGCYRGNQFLLVLSASIHKIVFACDSLYGGVRQDAQMVRWTN